MSKSDSPTRQRRSRSGNKSGGIAAVLESMPSKRPGDLHAPARLVGSLSQIQSRTPLLLLSAISLLLTWIAFPPVGFWPVSFFCLTPWLIGVCTAARARLQYFISYLFGLCYFLLHIYWMGWVTLPGYLALAVYLAFYFPLAMWPIRHMYRYYGLSVALTAPVVWVAMEYLRSTIMTGFPMVLVAHSFYPVPLLIQISDLVGAYGVSFVILMVNGLLVDLLIQPIIFLRSDQMVRLPLGTLTTVLVVVATLIYGSIQTSKAYLKPGPRVVVVQHDIPEVIPPPKWRINPTEVHLALAQEAAALEPKPDLIVMPETAADAYFNEDFLLATPDMLDDINRLKYAGRHRVSALQNLQKESRADRDIFQKLADESGISILMGARGLEYRPTNIPARVDLYNSAYLLKPNQKLPVARYDKVHLVVFGEYVPFKHSIRWLYDWLTSLMPWGGGGIDFSLSSGEGFNTFDLQASSQNGKTYRAAAPICFEEIMAYIPRLFALKNGDPPTKDIDMLLTVSNDGWFFHSSELEQHLASAVFRAVENRIAVARSVNSGESAIIDPTGKIRAKVALAEDKLAKLKQLEEKLASLYAKVEELDPLPTDSNQLAKVQGELFKRAKEIDVVAAALGPVFRFIGDRLQSTVAVGNGIATSKPERRKQNYDNIREQLKEDLATVKRWQDKPWMAPGVAVDEVMCDSRLTLYTRYGDRFSHVLVGLTGLIVIDWLIRRIRRKRQEVAEQDPQG